MDALSAHDSRLAILGSDFLWMFNGACGAYRTRSLLVIFLATARHLIHLTTCLEVLALLFQGSAIVGYGAGIVGLTVISLMTQLELLITLRGSPLWWSIVFFISVTWLWVVVDLVTRSSTSLVEDLASVIILVRMVILDSTILKSVVWLFTGTAICIACLHVSYINGRLRSVFLNLWDIETSSILLSKSLK